MTGRTASRLLLGLVLAASGCTTGAGDQPPTSQPIPTERPTVAASMEPGLPSPPAAPTASPLARELPSRVKIRELGIDLAVLSGDATVPGNPRDYPLCGVAQYLTTYRYLGRDGATTWIYAHAQEGMFLPLLEASRKRDGGASLLGMMVNVDSTADQRHRYRIVEVLLHALDRGVAANVPADTRRLVLQTSEGPNGTVPKLQVVAELVDVVPTPAGDEAPVASPTNCFRR